MEKIRQSTFICQSLAESIIKEVFSTLQCRQAAIYSQKYSLFNIFSALQSITQPFPTFMPLKSDQEAQSKQNINNRIQVKPNKRNQSKRSGFKIQRRNGISLPTKLPNQKIKIIKNIQKKAQIKLNQQIIQDCEQKHINLIRQNLSQWQEKKLCLMKKKNYRKSTLFRVSSNKIQDLLPINQNIVILISSVKEQKKVHLNRKGKIFSDVNQAYNIKTVKNKLNVNFQQQTVKDKLTTKPTIQFDNIYRSISNHQLYKKQQTGKQIKLKVQPVVLKYSSQQIDKITTKKSVKNIQRLKKSCSQFKIKQNKIKQQNLINKNINLGNKRTKKVSLKLKL